MNQANKIPPKIEEGNEKQIVKQYRDFLICLFKLIVKLINGAEFLNKSNEVYRLKLIYQELLEEELQVSRAVDGR